MISGMKRYLVGFALVIMAFSMTSCGILEMLGRTAGNTVQKVGALGR